MICLACGIEQLDRLSFEASLYFFKSPSAQRVEIFPDADIC
jgi:hypothetical protein